MDLKQVEVIADEQHYNSNANLGPCLLMGAASWLALFALYQWFS